MAGINKEFDYLVPEELGDQIGIGTLVRVELNGRRVGGWVVADGVEPAPGVRLRSLAKVTGWGPPAELIDLARWAAWRWAGRPATFLRMASPRRRVPSLPQPSRPRLPRPPPLLADGGSGDELPREAFGLDRAVVRLPPDADPFPLVTAACARGEALVLAPSVRAAEEVARHIRRLGRRVALAPHDWAAAAAGESTVVGTRAGAWMPAPGLAAVLVLDAHDAAYQDERAPTWNAWQVVAERAARRGVPCVLTSPCPTLEVLAWGKLLTPARARERLGWPVLQVVDRRKDDPRSGLYSAPLVSLLRSRGVTVCVLNRKGRARLLACAACGEIARCHRCRSATEQVLEGGLRCRACAEARPALCDACGAVRLKVLRVGVSRAREELESLVREPVGEVTNDTDEAPDERVVVGTEAALHRVRRADAVAFLDFDQELLAPRFRAAEDAMALLSRAARLVGGRSRAGRLLVQTRLPAHEVLDAALHADPARFTDHELPRRTTLRMPPVTAVAVVSGEAAAQFVAGLTGEVEVQGPADSTWLVRAPDHRTLCDALSAVPRPPGRLRVEVDPPRA